ncbi:hypothetical protein GYMLUDRAFT_238464 [Collybiopsis luxurians FD-317 M1]|nr:hypothetical protein GYMLUDRAFT_238464 [Collybiopsis luxurians FD-317 M1]
MDILTTMIFGLGLRFVLGGHAQGRTYPAILGVWEGACLRYLNNQALPSSTADAYLSYGVRLCIDFFITDSFAQILAIALWSFLGALALEVIETGNPATNGHFEKRDENGTSFTKIQSASISSFLTPSTSASPVVGDLSPRSPIDNLVDAAATASSPPVAPSLLSIVEAGRPVTPPVLNLPSEDSETRSSVIHGSYALPLPALVDHQSPRVAYSSIPAQSSSAPFPVMDREVSIQDELQTPMNNNDMPISEDNNEDELQTPLALPIANIPFEDLDGPPELDIGPSMLLGPPDIDPVPIPLSSVSSPLPVPMPAPVQSTTLESPVSSLHTLSNASSSAASPAGSVLSVTSPTRMYARGDELRKQAWKEERAKMRVETDLRKARTEGRTKDVFLLLGEMKAAQMRIDRLHMRAKRRYYQARNKPDSNTLQIDVHGLLVQEAVEETEEAFRDVLRNGHRFLRIIVGKGNHSRDGVPKLKPAIIQAMQQLSVTCPLSLRP